MGCRGCEGGMWCSFLNMHHSSILLEPQQYVFLLVFGADENLGAVEGIAGLSQTLSVPLTSAKEHCTS